MLERSEIFFTFHQLGVLAVTSVKLTGSDVAFFGHCVSFGVVALFGLMRVLDAGQSSPFSNVPLFGGNEFHPLLILIIGQQLCFEAFGERRFELYPLDLAMTGFDHFWLMPVALIIEEN